MQIPEQGPAKSNEPDCDSDPQADGEEAEAYRIPPDLYPLFYPRWAARNTLQGKLYRALYTEVELEVQPQSIFEEMEVTEITNAFWQLQEIQNSIADIVKSVSRTALASILAPMFDYHHDRAIEVAGDYYSGDPDKKKGVEGLVRAHGMGPEAISAEAITQRAAALNLLTRTTARLGLRREQIVEQVIQRREGRKGSGRSSLTLN